jgi:hypothetical protein
LKDAATVFTVLPPRRNPARRCVKATEEVDGAAALPALAHHQAR